MDTVTTAFPAFDGTFWLPGSGTVPVAPLYVELFVPLWFWVTAAVVIVAGAAALLLSSIPQRRWSIEHLRELLHLPPRHRHRHA